MSECSEKEKNEENKKCGSGIFSVFRKNAFFVRTSIRHSNARYSTTTPNVVQCERFGMQRNESWRRKMKCEKSASKLLDSKSTLKRGAARLRVCIRTTYYVFNKFIGC